MELQNPLPPHIVKHTHKILYSVIGVLLVVVIAGSVYWWRTIKSTPTIEQQETLAGADANNNGVRDDIESYIATKYTTSVATQEALMQFAKADEMYINGGDKAQIIANSGNYFRAWNCLRFVQNNDDQADKILDEIEAKILNTPERKSASDETDSKLGGTVLPRIIHGGEKTACDFDPDKPTSPTTSVDTSTWKTYTNSEYGFSLKIPSDWNPTISGQKELLVSLSKNLAPEGQAGPCDSAVDFYYDQSFTSDSDPVKNINGIQWKTAFSEVSGWHYDTTYLNHTYTFQITCEKENQTILENLLSTFKFTDSSSAADTSTWKTYTSTDYGIEFKYPTNLQMAINIAGSTEPGTSFWLGVPKIKWHYGVSVSPNNKNETLNEVFNEDYAQYKSNKQFKSTDFSNKDVSVGKVTAKLLLIDHSGAYTSKTVYVINNGYIYTIGSDNSQEDFDQFISTIKFLKPSITLPKNDLNIANWKIYNDSVKGFEIKYPANWLIQPLGSDLIKFQSPETYGPNAGSTNPVNIKVVSNPSKYDIMTWFKNSVPNEELVDQKTLSLNNATVIQAKVSGQLLLYTNTYIGSPDSIVSVATPDRSPYWDVYVQMLSTFKFTK